MSTTVASHTTRRPIDTAGKHVVTILVENASVRLLPDGDGGLGLVCGLCDADLCDIEHLDTLGTLNRMAENHHCGPVAQCPDCGRLHNPTCGPAACDCCAAIAERPRTS